MKLPNKIFIVTGYGIYSDYANFHIIEAFYDRRNAERFVTEEAFDYRDLEIKEMHIS